MLVDLSCLIGQVSARTMHNVDLNVCILCVVCIVPVAGSDGNVESSISIQEGWMRAIQFESFFVDDKHWDLCAIFTRIKHLEYTNKQCT